MALTRTIDEWPLLICGPILRRVSKDEVAVFAATKVPCDVTLIVGDAGSDVPGWVSDATRTRSLGQRLHVVVCHVKAPEGDKLTAGNIYKYDLLMTPPDTGVTKTLKDQPGLLTGSEPLGYTAGALPTFVVPPGLVDLNLLHSSCRKPHGGGPDALAMVDRLILRAREKGTMADRIKARPHQLLLTGDQIYADDVALTMLATLQEAGGLLCAQSPDETFPKTPPLTGDVVMTSPEVRPGTAREAFLKANSTLSSGEGMNHLMFFAEFCAMYVMCWSDELWPRDKDGKPTLGAAVVEKKLADENMKQRMELQSFLNTLRRVRRVLANVPTMMMFDDHEISDDWNVDLPWFDGSRTNPAQHRVVRNGLLAFAAFQAWGNDPARFTSGTPKDLLDLIAVPESATASKVTQTPSTADVFLNLNLTAAAGDRMTWNWTLPGPEHMVIALDTRTRRDYTSLGPLLAGLLTPSELERQLTAYGPKSSTDTKLRFVIAPAPVVGDPFVENSVSLLHVVDSLVKGVKVANRDLDYEAWCVNRITYQSMLRRLAAFGRVVVLSGDVHYAFTNHTAYYGAQGQAPARIVQLCSSGAKNSEIKTMLVQKAEFLVPTEGESWLGLEVMPAALRVLLLTELGPAVATSLTPFEKKVLDRVKLFGLFKGPAVVPLQAWRSPLAWAEVRGLANRGNPEDWRYKSKFAVDNRDGAARLRESRELDPRSPPMGAAQVTMHANKIVVGLPNIGQVQIGKDESGRSQVIHRLHFMTSADPVNAAQTWTEHKVPLFQPGPDERPTL